MVGSLISAKPIRPYITVFFHFFIFSSSPLHETMIKNAYIAIARKAKLAKFIRSFTIGVNMFVYICQASMEPTVILGSFIRNTFHAEYTVFITRIPTDTHIILDRHFFTASSSPEENKSLITQIIKNNTAISIKKFFIPSLLLRLWL